MDENFDTENIQEISGYPIIDSAIVTDSKQINMLVDSIYNADRENNSTAASCFNPRHAIRLADQPDQYILICFQCFQVKYSTESGSKTALISGKPAARFNAFAEKLGMQLEPDQQIAPDI